MIDLERFWGGDHRYFADTIRAHGPAVKRVCLSFRKSEDETDELVQGIFALVYEKRRTFRGDGPFAAWLNRVSINHCLSIHRSRKAETTALETLVARGGIRNVHRKTRNPAEELDRREAERALWKALDALPEKEREAIVLRFIEGRTPSECAEEMKITKASVRSNTSRGIKRLRGILKGDKQ